MVACCTMDPPTHTRYKTRNLRVYGRITTLDTKATKRVHEKKLRLLATGGRVNEDPLTRAEHNYAFSCHSVHLYNSDYHEDAAQHPVGVLGPAVNGDQQLATDWARGRAPRRAAFVPSCVPGFLHLLQYPLCHYNRVSVTNLTFFDLLQRDAVVGRQTQAVSGAANHTLWTQERRLFHPGGRRGQCHDCIVHHTSKLFRVRERSLAAEYAKPERLPQRGLHDTHGRLVDPARPRKKLPT